jgi:hypothetical protein
MWKSSWGRCCAVGLLWAGTIGQFAAAQTENDPGKAAVANNVAKIEAALDSQLKADLRYDETPLSDIVSVIADEFEIPIVFDTHALDEHSISPEVEITLNLRNVSLQSALNLMLQEPGLEDLTYVIENEVLLITTLVKAESNLQTRVYAVDDFQLAQSDSRGGGAAAGFNTLPEAIIMCVYSDSWQATKKGEGTIAVIQPGLMIVSQTQRVHREIEELLKMLRAEKAKLEKQADGEYSSGRF